MSGVQQIWQPGYPVTDEELERMADQAARAGDDELSCLLENRTGDKLVIPLVLRSTNQSSFKEPHSAQLINAPSGNTGYVRLGRAQTGALFVQRSATKNGFVTSLVGMLSNSILETQLASGSFAANSSGSPRTDAVYAQLTRVTGVTGSRKFKDPTTGAVSTQLLTLSTEARVTLAVAQTSATAPADTATAFNFLLARVTLPNGYALNQEVQQSWVEQAWTRGGLQRRLIPDYDQFTFAPDGRVSLATTYTGDRNPTGIRIGVPIKVAVGGGGNAAVLDSFHDWRGRMLRARLTRATSMGAGVLYPALQSQTVGGASVKLDSGLVFTGAGVANPHAVDGFWFASTPEGYQAHLQVRSSDGALMLAFRDPAGTGNVGDPPNGDHYWVEVTASHPMIAP
jgi:hypothetical protein